MDLLTNKLNDLLNKKCFKLIMFFYLILLLELSLIPIGSVSCNNNNNNHKKHNGNNVKKLHQNNNKQANNNEYMNDYESNPYVSSYTNTRSVNDACHLNIECNSNNSTLTNLTRNGHKN